MKTSKAHDDWLLAEQQAAAAANALAEWLHSGRAATAEQLAEVDRLRADATAKLRVMMDGAIAAHKADRTEKSTENG